MTSATIKLVLDGQAQVIAGIQSVERQLGGIGRGAQASAQASESLTAALARVGHYGIAGGALYGVAQSAAAIGRAVFEASASAQRLATQLNFATAGQGARELAFASDVAQRLGLNMVSTAQAYAGFASAARGTALEGAAARDVFEGIAKASAVMGLSSDQTSGALLAVQQMMSKGVVSAEEFRGQLGERMPIALQAGAQALGVTTAEFSKMLESGQIIAQDFLPKFSRAITEMLGDSVDQAANRLDAATARMGNAWTRLMQTVGDSGLSRAMASEATAISQYMDTISDSMRRAEKNGSGAFMQLSAGLGQIIARAPFDVLAGSANLLNGTINELTFGATRLNTNISLLPDALKSTAQQSLALERDLKAAKAELATLQEQAEKKGAGLYLRSAIGDVQRYIDKLEEAKKKQAGLGMDPIGGGRGTVNPPTVGQMEQAAAKRAADLLEVKQKLYNVDKDYLPTLNKLHEAYQAGDMTLSEYQDSVGRLAEKNYKAEKSTKDSAKAARDAAAEHEKLARAEQKHWEDLGRAITANQAAHARWLEQGDKTIEGLIAGNQTLREQNEAIGLSKEALDALTLARQDAAIAQAELTLIEAQNIEGNEARIEQIQREIRLLKERRDLTAAGQSTTAAAEAQKTAREVAEKTAKDAAAEWQKASDQIHQSLSDALMNAFMAGKGFGKTFVDSIKSMFNSMVLRPVISAIVSPVAGAMTSAMGFSGAANAATGGNLLSNIGTMGSLAQTAASWLGLGGATTAGIAANVGIGTAAGLTVAEATAAASAAGAAASGGMAAAMGPVMQGLMTAAPYLAAVAAVYLIAKSLDKSGTPHSGGGSAYSAASGLSSTPVGGWTGGTTWGDGFGSVVGKQDTTDMTAKLTQSIVGILDSTATAFGKSAGYMAATSFADDSSKDPAWGSLVIKQMDNVLVNWADTRSSKWAPRTFSDGSAGSAEYIAAISTDVRAALDGIGLPGWATTMLDALGAAPGLDQLAATVAEINKTQTALAQMGRVLTGFGTLSDGAVQALIKAAGGIDSLATAASTYYDNFYTEAEKAAATTASVADALGAVGLAMPATREAFRALVERQQALGEAGAPALAALLKVSGAFASVVPAAQQAGSAIDGVSDRLADLKKETQSLEVELLSAQGKTEGAKALQRAINTLGFSQAEIEVYDYNQSLRDQIDAINGAREAEQALASERLSLTQQLWQATNQTAQIRANELANLDPSNRPIQQALYDIADAQTAFGALQSAVQTEKDRLTRQFETDKAALQEQAQADTSALKDALDAQQDAIKAELKAKQDAYAAQISAAEAARSDITAIASDLANAVKAVKIESDAYDLARLQSARSLIAGAASTGNVKAAGLEDALSIAAQDSKRFYSTFEDYAFEQARTAGDIARLNDAAQSQLSGFDQTIVALKAQDDLAKTLADAQLAAAKAQYDLDVASAQTAAAAAAESNAAQLAALQAQYDADMAALDKTVSEAQKQLNALLGIDASVQTVAQAVNAFGSAVMTAMAQVAAVQASAAISAAQATAAAATVAVAPVVSEAVQSASAATQPRVVTGPPPVKAGMYGFDVGTNYVPYDMVAKIHEGEAIVPKAYNPAAGGASSAELVRAITALQGEIKGLKVEMGQVSRHARRTADAVNGNPEAPMLVESV